MNDAIITAAVFFLLFVMMAQIRFLRLIRKMTDKKITGGLFLADILGCCRETCEIYVERSTDREVWKKKSLEDMGYVEERAPDDYEIKSAIEESKRKEEMDYQSEEDKNKVKDLLSKRQKTSIMYISNRTLLPKERIIEIILEDPDFIIEHEYVINKKMPAKRVIKTQEMKRIEDKIAAGFCPVCDTPLDSSWEFCSNCGYVLK